MSDRIHPGHRATHGVLHEQPIRADGVRVTGRGRRRLIRTAVAVVATLVVIGVLTGIMLAASTSSAVVVACRFAMAAAMIIGGLMVQRASR